MNRTGELNRRVPPELEHGAGVPAPVSLAWGLETRLVQSRSPPPVTNEHGRRHTLKQPESGVFLRAECYNEYNVIRGGSPGTAQRNRNSLLVEFQSGTNKGDKACRSKTGGSVKTPFER